MSTRALLNKTSQKKRDTMLSYTNFYASGVDPSTYITTDAVMRAEAGTTVFGWMPSARPAESATGQKGSKIDTMVRTSTTIYAVGTKENIIISTNGPTAWEWRRITFQVKAFFDTIDPESSTYFRRTPSNGMVRLVTPIGNPDLFLPLFRGQRNVDWISEMNAPVDTAKVDLKSDVRRVIKSGNEGGTIRHYKMWYPIKKNITYRDDEEGESMFLSPVSTQGKAGSGDYYIMDFFKAVTNTAGATLSFLPNATFYWHEK